MPNGELINEMLVSAKGPTEKAMAEYARHAWELKAHIQNEIKEEEKAGNCNYMHHEMLSNICDTIFFSAQLILGPDRPNDEETKAIVE